VWSLVTHQGTYGFGPEGAPGANTIVSNLDGLAAAVPAVFVASGVALAVAVMSFRSSQRTIGGLAATIGLLIQTVVLLAMVAKHPGVRYLLPIAATLPVLIAATLEGFEFQSTARRVVAGLSGTALLGGFVVSLSAAVGGHVDTFARLQRDDSMTEQLLSRFAQERGIERAALQTLWTYDTTSPCYALWFGDDSAARVFLGEITRMCPRDQNLNIWNGEVTTRAGDVRLADYADWDVIVVPTLETRNRPYLGLSGGLVVPSMGLLGERDLAFIASTRVATAGR
jgi:hypothetical protein